MNKITNITEAADASVEAYIYLFTEQSMLTEGIKDLTVSQINNMQTGTANLMKKVEKALESKGVRIGIVKKRAKRAATKYSGIIKAHEKRGTDPKIAARSLVKAMAIDLKDTVKEVYEDFDDFTLGEKVLMGILVFIGILYINTMLGSIFFIITQDPKIAGALTAIFVAPIVEEAAKKYFAEWGMPWIGTGIVFGLEFAMYVVQMALAGITLGKVIILRVVGLIMHFTTQAIQVKGKEEDWVKTAYVVSVLIHATFNLVGTIFASPIEGWALKG